MGPVWDVVAFLSAAESRLVVDLYKTREYWDVIMIVW